MKKSVSEDRVDADKKVSQVQNLRDSKKATDSFSALMYMPVMMGVVFGSVATILAVLILVVNFIANVSGVSWWLVSALAVVVFAAVVICRQVIKVRGRRD